MTNQIRELNSTVASTPVVRQTAGATATSKIVHQRCDAKVRPPQSAALLTASVPLVDGKPLV